MLEITRGRTWDQYHTMLVSKDGPVMDMDHIVTVKSQLREKNATRNSKGIFEHALVAEITVTLGGTKQSQLRQRLTRAQTTALNVGDYMIDAVGTDAGGQDWSIQDPTPILVVNRPTVIA